MVRDERVDLWYLIGSLQVGGANRTLVELANGLDENRYDVTIWTILPDNPLATDLDDEVDHRSLDARGKYDLPAALTFCRMLRRKQPDLLQSFLFFDNMLARVGSLVSSMPVITGVRAVPQEPSRVREFLNRQTIPFSTHIVSNSEEGADLAVRRGAAPTDVSVILNGRDIQTYREATPPPRGPLGLDPESTLVGTVGRLIERKGCYDLLDSWSTVQEAHPRTELLFVGDGPERSGLEQRARDLGVAESVHFLGFRDDVPELLALLDLFVFPSHFEGLPGALIEAMAAGLPIVATDAVGNEELITDERTGLLVPVRDIKALGEGMIRALTDETMAEELGEAAARTAHQEYTIDQMVSSFSSLYDSLLAHGE